MINGKSRSLHLYLLLAMVLVISVSGVAAEYSATAYMLDGQIHKCKLIKITRFEVVLRIDGLPRRFSQAEVGLLTFDNSLTDFEADQRILHAKKHPVVFFKDGTNLAGQVTSLIPRGKTAILRGSGDVYFSSRDIARIYFDAEKLFTVFEVKAKNRLVFRK